MIVVLGLICTATIVAVSLSWMPKPVASPFPNTLAACLDKGYVPVQTAMLGPVALSDIMEHLNEDQASALIVAMHKAGAR